MFPLQKRTEVRQVPEGKAGEKRRSSNSHPMPKMEPGWEWWELTRACNNLGKIFCWKNIPLCFCQTYLNSCTFKSVKLPASVQIAKHLLLLKHLKKPHTSYSSFLLLTSKAVSCNKMPSDNQYLFPWLARTKLLGDYACTVSSFLHFALWEKQMHWSWWGTGFSVTQETLLWTLASLLTAAHENNVSISDSFSYSQPKFRQFKFQY